MTKLGFSNETPFEGKTNDWRTPSWIIEAFDQIAEKGDRYFGLDPCASTHAPLACAKRAYILKDNGLRREWDAAPVWLNPPYGPHTEKWVRRLVRHGDGIALIYARTDTALWQGNIFPYASAYLFIAGRVQFLLPDGTLPEDGNPGAPSCLIAFGENNAKALEAVSRRGLIDGALLLSASVWSTEMSKVQRNKEFGILSQRNGSSKGRVHVSR